MTDENGEDLSWGPPPSPKRWHQLIAEAKSRAEEILTTSPSCELCGGLITTQGRTARRHVGCEPGTLVGKACSCPAGCSREFYGDGDVACDPSCVVCSPRAGQRIFTTKKRT